MCEIEESNPDTVLSVFLIGNYVKVKYPLNHFEVSPWGWLTGAPQELPVKT